MTTHIIADASDFVPAVVERYHSDPSNLVQILREVQDAYGAISDAALDAISTGLWVPRVQVQGVADFYSFLSDSGRGRYDIRFSNNITDRYLGSPELMAQLCRHFGAQAGVTRPDGLLTVDATSCTGLGDQGPAALINGLAVTRLDAHRINTIAGLIDEGAPLSEWPEEYFQVIPNVRRADRLLTEALEEGEALRVLVERGEEAILAELAESGLRGRGGAGFSTAVKWQACRKAEADERYVVCNADEGEPGTFKDRVLLQEYADMVFDGMTVCGRVIGAARGVVYLRGEYRYLLDHLMDVLERRRRAWLLGENILGQPGFCFDIDIHLGAGAYICGEESALIESLEGKRGVPRKRPPFPVTHGLHGRPTVVNNVETFAAAAKITVHGGEWFAQRGTNESTGTKLLSVSGDCAEPGVYEFPFGVTVNEVLQACGAQDTQAVQVSGPAGHTVPPCEFDRAIAFEDLPTGGSFMVFDASRDMLEVTRNFASFFAHESCGFCTPCRVGTSLMRDLLEKVRDGHGTEADLGEMRQVADVMRHTSHCGLGQTAANPVMDLLEKFDDVYRHRMTNTAFQPAFDMDSALEEARRLTGRDDEEAHL